MTAAELLRVIGHCAELVAEHEAARAILLRHAATLRLAEELATQDSQGVTRDTPAHQAALPSGAGQSSCAPGLVNPRPGAAADAAADRRGKGGVPAPGAAPRRASRRVTPEVEAEVARLAAAGLNGMAIARQLGLSIGSAYRARARVRAAAKAAQPASRGGPQPAAVIRAWGLAHGARINVMGGLDAEDLRRVNARRGALNLAPFVLQEKSGDAAA